MKKRLFAVLSMCFIVILFASCSGEQKVTKDNLPANSVYSQSLGKVVHLGMEKDEVDKLLGSGQEEDDGYYVYQPDNLTIQYVDGKVNAITCQYPDKDWMTKGKFTIDSEKTTVEKYYSGSISKAESGKNELIYGYGADNAVTNTNAQYGIAYIFGIDDKVKTFSIANAQ